MNSERISVTFEPNVPVVGQILILEAIEFLYSTCALMSVGWSDRVTNSGDWPRFLEHSPGKLLRREHLLWVESAHASAVTEVLSGVEPAIKLLKRIVAIVKAQRKEQRAKTRLNMIREELLPLIEKLRQAGVPEDRIRAMLEKAALYTEEVLVDLLEGDKLKIDLPL